MHVSVDASGSVSAESEAQPAAQGIERVLVNTMVSNDAEGGRVFVARYRISGGGLKKWGSCGDEGFVQRFVAVSRERKITWIRSAAHALNVPSVSSFACFQAK